jgi:hypothetical protein
MWTAPAVMFIEAAADSLKSADPKMLAAEVKELGSFGSTRITDMMDTLWPSAGDVMDNAFSGMEHDTDVIFAQGYLLGLQTARQMLAGSAALILKQIDPTSIL